MKFNQQPVFLSSIMKGSSWLQGPSEQKAHISPALLMMKCKLPPRKEVGKRGVKKNKSFLPTARDSSPGRRERVGRAYDLGLNLSVLFPKETDLPHKNTLTCVHTRTHIHARTNTHAGICTRIQEITEGDMRL